MSGILRASLLVFALVLSVQGQAVSNYAYGTLPSVASDTDLNDAYTTWKSRRRTTGYCTNSLRVSNGGGTYSEGQAYGMLFAAYLDATDADAELLWNQAAGMQNTRGLMNWNVSSCSNAGDGATDADLDLAAACIQLHRRFPAGNKWKTRAQNVLNAMYTHMRDTCNSLKNGDTWGGCTDGGPKNYNPSYFRTGYLKSFDCFEGGTRWEAVRTRSYTVLDYSYDNYSLPPDWLNASFQFGAATNSAGYGYDSCRTPWSLAQDYLWWGNTTAKDWCDKIANVFKSKGGGTPTGAADDVGDDYNYSTGAKASNNHNNEFIGSAAVSMMTNSANLSFLNAFYTELDLEDDNTYYSDSLKVVYLMILTGKFEEPCLGSVPPGSSPTRTPTRTPSSTASPTPTPAFSLSKSAASATVAAGSQVTYYLSYMNLSSGPDTSGVTAGVSLEFNNGNAGSTGSSSNLNFRIANNSGAAISLANYRIRYFLYDAGHTATTDYTTYAYNNPATGVATMVAYPTYIGARSANMEFRVTWASGTVATGATQVYEGAISSASYSWTLTFTDDWSYPGSVGSYSAANAANVVLEQNVAGTWKPVTGAYPGGAASITNVVITDTLNANLSLVSCAPTNSGSGNAITVTLATLAPAAGGNVTIVAQVGAGVAAGTIIPNSATIGSSGLPSAISNTYNITVGAGASPTRTRTPTPSASVTPSRTSTSTATPSRTSTSSASPTNATSPTGTATPSASPTSSQTRTATPSATSAQSATATATRSGTATSTQTSLPSATHTQSRTPSPSSTASSVSSATATSTRSASPTASRTATSTGTATSLNTATSTNTPAPSSTQTSTRTASPTSSGTATPSASGTATPSRTLTATATSTATVTSLNTATSTNTAAPSATQSSTRTASPTSSGTATPSSSTTPSSSRTGTPTSTYTRTATPSPTITESFTAVPTGSSPTNTPTITLSFTASPTDTRTASPSPSATGTPSRTATGTASQSSSPTTTSTPSVTASATPSSSITASPTNMVFTATNTPVISATSTETVFVPTASRTITGTNTALPTASSTITSLNTATSTSTISPTRTITETVTPGNTVTISVTPTSTHSRTATSSSSATPTQSSTRTATPTASRTSTQTSTSTRSATPSSTNTNTPGDTPTSTRTGTPSSTATVSATVSPSSTATATPSVTRTNTTLPTGTLTQTPTASVSPTQSSTAAATLVPSPGSFGEVEQLLAYPNPWPTELAIKATGRMESVKITVYTKSMVKVAGFETGALRSGWNRVKLPHDVLGLPTGLYYFVYQAPSGKRLVAKAQMLRR